MGSINRQMGLGLGILFLTMVALAPAAFAGDYHTGAGLRCSDCHAMHASINGTTYGTGGAGITNLLKVTTAAGVTTTTDSNVLCLSCHDGTDTTAPDVVSTGVATTAGTKDDVANAYTSVFKNSGGYFQSDCKSATTAMGHNLAGGNVTAVQGTWATTNGKGMECIDCHSPHGNANYRNLATNPGGVVTPVEVRGGVSGTQEVYLREAITVPADATATATHYDTDAVRFNDPNNIVAWCTGCHTNLTSSSTTKHPQNVSITGTHVESANWDSGIAGTDPGFGNTIDFTSTATDRGIPRVRFGQAGASYADCSTVASATNKVFCLSCHKAHGSRVDSSLLWPHFRGNYGAGTVNPADISAACNQCHAKGS